MGHGHVLSMTGSQHRRSGSAASCTARARASPRSGSIRRRSALPTNGALLGGLRVDRPREHRAVWI